MTSTATSPAGSNVIPLYAPSGEEQQEYQNLESSVEAVITERIEEKHDSTGGYSRSTETRLRLFGKPHQISEILGPWLPYVGIKGNQAAIGAYGAVFGSNAHSLAKALSGFEPSGSAQSAPTPASEHLSGTKPDQCRVLVEGVDEPLSLSDALAIATKWEAINERRVQLIEKEANRQITAEEAEELRHLQNLAWAKRQMVMPLPLRELAAIEEALRRKGLWTDE